ncbi:MAG: HD domain-containing protein [Saprospiraceae bacterium]
MNKKKIFNDPIYGLIRFHHDTIYEIIDHPYFQRLRRISQQALSHLVYPGALHTRFQHALGATYLMCRALDTLITKGIVISDQEYEAACVAILLHDVGHGPFSHALEHTLADVHHERISLLLMQKIGLELHKDFQLAVSIFTNNYHRPFFHELVSGQIDVDRMDYLTRDSFFSGVAEGIIGYDRIITMMHVVNDHLVIEEKGIYSIEKFLMARRLMYWQVYMHKTVISSEVMLISILKRAKYLAQHGVELATSSELNYFLKLPIENKPLEHDHKFLNHFVLLDDIDLMWMIKKSVDHSDIILKTLCSNLLERKLFKVYLQTSDMHVDFISTKVAELITRFNINKAEIDYFLIQKSETFSFYNSHNNEINILLKNGEVKSFSKLVSFYSDIPTEKKDFTFCVQ